jgi:3-methyladenine DNA glycosylase/8-oxoguanine DNA glycosylase
MATTVLTDVTDVSVDVKQSFTLQNVGSSDPTAACALHHFEKVHVSHDGRVVHHQVAVLHGQLHHTTTIIDDDANSNGDITALRLRLDADTRADAFAATAAHHPLVHRLHRQHHALRLLPVPWLFDVAASMVLQQRVRFVDAARSFAAIARRFGKKTSVGLCFPHPRVIAALAPDELMPLGVDGQRARALQAIAREALHSDLLHPLVAGGDDDAVRKKRAVRLQRLPGIGPWTTGMIMGFGFGDADAVVTGDLHLPHLVCAVLGGDTNGTDARMEELLLPFAGERFRVVRLLWSGRFGKRPVPHAQQ